MAAASTAADPSQLTGLEPSQPVPDATGTGGEGTAALAQPLEGGPSMGGSPPKERMSPEQTLETEQETATPMEMDDEVTSPPRVPRPIGVPGPSRPPRPPALGGVAPTSGVMEAARRG